jgi:hypothetical protein
MKTEDNYTYVRITRIYIMTDFEAKQAVALARVLSADTKYFSKDEDGTKLTVDGNDYLMEDGSPDVLAAMNDIPDPELLLQIECVESLATAVTRSDLLKGNGLLRGH